MKWCEDCEFWKGRRPNDEGRPQEGECHRYAPTRVTLFGDEGPKAVFGTWPITLPHDFCGEIREKAA